METTPTAVISFSDTGTGLSHKYAERIAVGLPPEDTERIEIFAPEDNLESKRNDLNSLVVLDTPQRFMFFVPTYHNAIPGLAKSWLDSLSDEAYFRIGDREFIVVGTSYSPNGAKQFAEVLKFGIRYQNKLVKPDITVITPEPNEYKFGEVSETYLDKIVEEL